MSKRKVPAIGKRASVLAACCAMFALSCSSGSTSATSGSALGLPGSAGAPGTPTSSADAHPMRADKLRDVMKSFDAAVRKDVPGEVDEHDRWEGIYPRIADAAAELEVAASSLAGHPPKGLELPARGRFSVLGRALGEAAAGLKDAAARNDADAVELARKNLASACRDCHRQFRPDADKVPEAFE